MNPNGLRAILQLEWVGCPPLKQFANSWKASYNNEFGRPVITGYLRTLLTQIPIGGGKSRLRGYHKPILIAGGLGSVRRQLGTKDPTVVHSGDICVVIGGPSMLIGVRILSGPSPRVCVPH